MGGCLGKSGREDGRLHSALMHGSVQSVYLVSMCFRRHGSLVGGWTEHTILSRSSIASLTICAGQSNMCLRARVMQGCRRGVTKPLLSALPVFTLTTFGAAGTRQRKRSRPPTNPAEAAKMSSASPRKSTRAAATRRKAPVVDESDEEENRTPSPEVKREDEEEEFTPAPTLLKTGRGRGRPKKPAATGDDVTPKPAPRRRARATESI
jgi:hypothetical protein